MKTRKQNRLLSLQKFLVIKSAFIIMLLMTESAFEAQDGIQQDKSSSLSDDHLIDQYAQSKGDGCILFDTNNIKLFWTDNTVISKNDVFEVFLKRSNNSFESALFKFQLANVFETQDCSIDIISSDSDLSYSILGKNNKNLSVSTKGLDFINFHTFSSTFHLEDTEDFVFSIRFNSTKEMLSIKTIILSFSNNKKSAYDGSPGFNQLMKQIDEEGIAVPNSDVRYIILKEYNKIYIRVPSEIISSYYPFYHVYPMKKENLLPDREKYGFNNYDKDISLTNEHTCIPRPYNSNKKYSIIQQNLPSYDFTLLKIGQDSREKNILRCTPLVGQFS